MEEINFNRIVNLHQLLDYNARRFISAEIQLNKTLPGWINAAGSLKLKEILQKYRGIVQQHVDKLQKFIEEENVLLLNTSDQVMKSIIEETDEMMSCCADVPVRNACLLAGIQLINHYKISTYGTAAAFSKALGMEKYGALFHEIEVNEKQIDDRLSQLAEFEINAGAVAPVVLTE